MVGSPWDRARALLFVVLLVVTSCMKSQVSSEDELGSLLGTLDRQWALRGATPVREDWGRPSQMSPELRRHPEVRWRLARAHVTRGLSEVDDGAARRALSDGRAEAMACLEDETAVANARVVSGWPAAIANVSDARQRCALWAGVAWTRWLEIFGGAAGAMDLPTVTALLHRAEVGAHADLVDVATWHMGLLLALRPHHLGQRRQEAVRHLQDAYARAAQSNRDEVWLRWCDLRRWDAVGEHQPPRFQATHVETIKAAQSCRGVASK